jgi:AcrR family transcriptional regulator
MDPNERKRLILAAAFKVAKSHGFKKATRAAIAAEAGVNPALVGHYLGGRADLREAIFKEAVKAENTKMIRDGFENGIGAGVRIPKELRAAL